MNPRTLLFIRWWVHQLRTFDCDPAIVAMKYIINRMELNTEQRYWFCFLYANTYHLPTAWVIFNEFPDFENTPLSRIALFSKSFASRLPYQKDQKWLRGNLGETFQSYSHHVGLLHSQAEFFDTERGNFSYWWNRIIKDFYKFGRYTTWFYMQALKEVCGLPFAPTDLMLDFDSSKMHRMGLRLALGFDISPEDYQPEMDDFAALNSGAAQILEKVSTVTELTLLPVQPDYFSMETSLCSFRKLFRRKQGRYLGFYHDRFARDIEKATEADWPGINWQLFWDFREECLIPQMLGSLKSNEWQMNLFLDLETFHGDEALMKRLDDWLLSRLQ